MLVCVDGNIGVGKSSALDEIRRRGYTVHEEGVHRWQGLLSAFYACPERWSFTFQMAILTDMVSQYELIKEQLRTGSTVFIERSPMSALVFVYNSYQSGHMNKDEFDTYMKFHERLAWNADVTIMLTAPLDVCMQRVHTRQRDGESGITMEYLEELSRGYQKHASEVHCHIVDNTGHINDTVDRIVGLVVPKI